MPINFFDAACKSSSNKNKFGLCDTPPPPTTPAYIDEIDESKWIAIVKNPDEIEVEFLAIDACIDIRKPDGNLESRCDGLLIHQNRLTFIELKSREGGPWLKKGRAQLTTTIDIFRNNHDISQFVEISANVCNSLRPQSHTGHAANIQQFFDETGFIMRADRTVNI